MKMKTQIALAVTLGVLFVAVPSATPKGAKPAGLTLSAVCSEGSPDTGTDSCSVNATGLSADTYLLTGTSDCGVESSSNVSPGQFPVTVNFSDSSCNSGGFTFNLYVLKRGVPTLVATSAAFVI
jgi:hypothetical protein